jgi:hypothetical protein
MHVPMVAVRARVCLNWSLIEGRIMSEKYHLRQAVRDEAKPLLHAAGFREDETALRGFSTFTRSRADDLVEAVVF